jgi:hypothetical protein
MQTGVLKHDDEHGASWAHRKKVPGFSDVVEVLVCICSYFSAAELMERSLISKRWRRACDIFFGPQRSYFLRSVTQQAVEIALPSCVLAARYDPHTSYLYVACTSGGSGVWDEEQEIVLYVRSPQYDLECSEELDLRCSATTTTVAFDGPFLKVPARDGELQLFDCKRLLPVRMPQVFASNFGSSADGTVAVLTLPENRLRLLRPYDAPINMSSPTASSSSGRMHVRKFVDLEECVSEEIAAPSITGDVYTVCVSTQFVCLMHGEPAAWEATAIIIDSSRDSPGSTKQEKNQNRGVVIPFRSSLAPRKRLLGKGSFVTRIDSDEKSILFFETFSQSLYRWTPLTNAFEVLWRPSPSTSSRVGSDRFLSSFSILHPSLVYALMSRNSATNEYSLHIRSWDRTLERRIPLRGPSIVTCHPRNASILVSLVGAVVPRHPLVEAIESGVATLLVFGRSSMGGSDWHAATGDEEGPEKGIRTLTLLTFGLVGFSLAWTLWALFYFGWWMRIN